MIIHEQVHDMAGAGKWDIHTTRYVPIYGGSRSKLPIHDDPEYRRYHGFVGIDDFLTPDIHLMSTLYQFMGGKPVLPPGEVGQFTALLLGETTVRLEESVAEGSDSPAL